MRAIHWLASGLIAGACLTATVAPSGAQTTTKIKISSAFPITTNIYGSFQRWAEHVEKLSGGRIDFELLPTGSVVPPFEVLDATHKKVLDGAHSGAAYWVGKHRAAALFGVTPGGPFGMDMIDYLGWLHDGGGLELYQEFYQKELKRDIVVRTAHFSLIPLMVAQSLLVLTTGRLFCSRYVDSLPVRIVRCPVMFPPLTYYQLWHDVTHAAASMRWLREQVRDVARNLSTHGMLQRNLASRNN